MNLRSSPLESGTGVARNVALILAAIEDLEGDEPGSLPDTRVVLDALVVERDAFREVLIAALFRLHLYKPEWDGTEIPEQLSADLDIALGRAWQIHELLRISDASSVSTQDSAPAEATKNSPLSESQAPDA